LEKLPHLNDGTEHGVEVPAAVAADAIDAIQARYDAVGAAGAAQRGPAQQVEPERQRITITPSKVEQYVRDHPTHGTEATEQTETEEEMEEEIEQTGPTGQTETEEEMDEEEEEDPLIYVKTRWGVLRLPDVRLQPGRPDFWDGHHANTGKKNAFWNFVKKQLFKKVGCCASSSVRH
jgi:hypothetical protein